MTDAQDRLLNVSVACWHTLQSLVAVREGIPDSQLQALGELLAMAIERFAPDRIPPNWKEHRVVAINQAPAEGVMRSRDEIQRAHDLMHFLMTPEAPVVFSQRDAVSAAHDTLAWALRFHGDCGDAFQANIDFALESLRRLGIKIVDAGEAISEEEARRRGML